MAKGGRAGGEGVVASDASARIRGEPVSPLLPDNGPVHVLLIGEAPGPRGADKSGIPFFGDAAGRPLYNALRAVGAIELPDTVDSVKWDGAVLIGEGFRPVARGVALGNAFDRCPTDDGAHFRAPSSGELEGEENRARLMHDINLCRERGLRGIVTLGRVASRVLTSTMPMLGGNSLIIRALPHPSAQGLLSMAPDRGRGARMADLQQEWMRRCIQVVREVGWS